MGRRGAPGQWQRAVIWEEAAVRRAALRLARAVGKAGTAVAPVPGSRWRLAQTLPGLTVIRLGVFHFAAVQKARTCSAAHWDMELFPACSVPVGGSGRGSQPPVTMRAILGPPGPSATL